MARPYSDDLRERVIDALNSGATCRAVAKRFGVSVSAVVKWSQRYRATGSDSAKRMGGHRPLALAGESEWLRERIEGEADVSLRRLQAELAERGTVVSYGAVWNFVHRNGLSHKKNRGRR
jgi:transposase